LRCLRPNLASLTTKVKIKNVINAIAFILRRHKHGVGATRLHQLTTGIHSIDSGRPENSVIIRLSENKLPE